MIVKKVVTTVLLLFVAVSVVVLIAGQTSETSRSPDAGPVGSAGQEIAGSAPDADAARLQENRVIVYYFHGNARCPTCLTLEAYSKEAVETRFAEELKRGRVVWQVVNFDETWNEHFIRQYDLAFQSLVVVKVRGGKDEAFKNLEGIWDLVGDKEAYFEYVTREVRSCLEGV